MKSMTGFGRATALMGSTTVGVQVTSVNRKGLDLTMKVPEAWGELEALIGERVRAVATRGKVHVEVVVARPSAGGDAPWEDAHVSALLDRLSALAEQQGVPFEPTLDLLWQIASSQRGDAEALLTPEQETALLHAVDEALRSFAAMRAREGEALLIDFITRLDTLRRHVAGVTERAPQVVPTYRDILFRRLREAGLELNLEDERVLKEVALFADRCDVSEELTRLRSHLQQFEQLLRSEGEIGRKGEFILQEVGREVHTIGSKANDLLIARHVIELKNELERIREQMANVE
jgi:uncharacterized protein (TIGR00255 family)